MNAQGTSASSGTGINIHVNMNMNNSCLYYKSESHIYSSKLTRCLLDLNQPLSNDAVFILYPKHAVLLTRLYMSLLAFTSLVYM